MSICEAYLRVSEDKIKGPFLCYELLDVLMLICDRADRIVCEEAQVRAGKHFVRPRSWRILFLAVGK